jgi:hypothetical protein
MNDINKLETLDEMFEKAQSNDDFDALESLHTNTDCWEKTNCPMQTEIFTFADNDGYNESVVNMWAYKDIKTLRTESIEVDRVAHRDIEDDPYVESTWDIDVELFIYKGYIYTISNEYIHDAQTFSCQSITRRPLVEDFRK